MDSFEINKIMGAVLATLLGLMVVHIGANAPVSRRTCPKSRDTRSRWPSPRTSRRRQPAAPTEEPLPQRLAAAPTPTAARPPSSAAWPATRSRRAARTASAPTSTAWSAAPSPASPGFNYSRRHAETWRQVDAGSVRPLHPQSEAGRFPAPRWSSPASPAAAIAPTSWLYLNQQSDKPVDLPKEAPKASRRGRGRGRRRARRARWRKARRRCRKEGRRDGSRLLRRKACHDGKARGHRQAGSGSGCARQP